MNETKVKLSGHGQYYAVPVELGTDNDIYLYHIHHTSSGEWCASIKRHTDSLIFAENTSQPFELIIFCAQLNYSYTKKE